MGRVIKFVLVGIAGLGLLFLAIPNPFVSLFGQIFGTVAFSTAAIKFLDTADKNGQ
jgi:hypothetical protein